MNTPSTPGKIAVSVIIAFLITFSFFCNRKPSTLLSGDSRDQRAHDSASIDHCYDLSNHKVSFITTEPGVSLEVLDWGGTGDYLLLLTGLGDNAHVFDNFAYQFTDLYHVIGITRRGFGRSSKPKTGYDEATRVRDYISIMDQLKIPKALFAAHSIGCGELNYLGSHYQDRINKLVYMDGMDYGEHKLLKQPPGPDYRDDEVGSLEQFIAATVRYNGYREPNAALCNIYTLDSAGKVTGTISPPEVTKQIIESSVITDYGLITAPVLGIFETWIMKTRLPYYWYLDSIKKAEYDSAWKPLYDWRAKQLNRFRKEIKNSRVIEVQNSNHYIFINNEAEVARTIREFLKEN